MTAALAELSQRLETLERAVAKVQGERDSVQAERDQYRQLYLEMMERCRKLERGLIGPSSEDVRSVLGLNPFRALTLLSPA